MPSVRDLIGRWEAETKRPAQSPSSAASPRPKRCRMSARLHALDDSLTLNILQRMDFQSLTAMEGVSRKFHRLASDPSLYTRLGHLHTEGDSSYEDVSVRSDCARLGSFPLSRRKTCSLLLTEQLDAVCERFLRYLERLLDRGADESLRSLHIGCGNTTHALLPSLAVFLKKRGVELTGLGLTTEGAMSEERVKDFLASQPSIRHLFVHSRPASRDWHQVPWKTEGLSAALPGLRHLDLWTEPGGEDACRWLRALAPQLRSASVVQLSEPLPETGAQVEALLTRMTRDADDPGLRDDAEAVLSPLLVASSGSTSTLALASVGSARLRRGLVQFWRLNFTASGFRRAERTERLNVSLSHEDAFVDWWDEETEAMDVRSRDFETVYRELLKIEQRSGQGERSEPELSFEVMDAIGVIIGLGEGFGE